MTNDTSKLKPLILLLLRSPDKGEGWRTVSNTLMRLVRDFPDQSLIEWGETETGGRVRLSDKGNTIAPYL